MLSPLPADLSPVEALLSARIFPCTEWTLFEHRTCLAFCETFCWINQFEPMEEGNEKSERLPSTTVGAAFARGISNTERRTKSVAARRVIVDDSTEECARKESPIVKLPLYGCQCFILAEYGKFGKISLIKLRRDPFPVHRREVPASRLRPTPIQCDG